MLASIRDSSSNYSTNNILLYVTVSITYIKIITDSIYLFCKTRRIHF